MGLRRDRHRADGASEPGQGPHDPGGSDERVGEFRGQFPAPPDEDARPGGAGEIVVLIPIFNDWESLALLLPELDNALSSRALQADVLIVDDGSTDEPKGDLIRESFAALRRIDVLRLRRNLGHQRAIAVGLAYIEDCLGSRAVVVMDGDGEDDPADVPQLLKHLDEDGRGRIIFADRTRRSEPLGFRVFYALYRTLHHVLTGQKVRVGNFSAIPRRRLSSLVVVTELWNHYAAAVIRSRQPHCSIPTRRAVRLCGRSKMNFVSLVTHGLSAISVYSDVVGVRLLVLSALLAIVMLLGIAVATIVRLTTEWAVPGWASSTVGIFLILLGQAVLSAFVFSFMILGSRHGSPFLPRRDYSFFVGSVWSLHPAEPCARPMPAAGKAVVVPSYEEIAR